MRQAAVLVLLLGGVGCTPLVDTDDTDTDDTRTGQRCWPAPSKSGLQDPTC